MLTSKFLTASLTALAMVGAAGLVYAQTTSTPDASVQAQPGTQAPTSDMNRNTDALNQGTGTTNLGTGTMNQGGTTMGLGTDGRNQDRVMDQRLAARADRN
jgi:hypothetical protein